MTILRTIDTDLWVAEQPLKYFGLEVGTRMTVIRLNQNQLLVISPIDPDGELLEHLNQLGQVSVIIAPNLYHHLFLNQFRQNYREAELWAPTDLQQKRPDLQIDRVLSDHTINLLDGIEAEQVIGFSTLTAAGYAPLSEWAFFHVRSRTLIITDLAFYIDRTSSRPVQLAFKLLGGYQQLRPSWLEKLATQDKEQVQHSIRRILAWDFERVILARGSIVEQEGKRQFQQGYEWFLGKSLSKP
ncbi:DUF4336 domain-containing protein [Leptolyngbya sp. AN03gr2]|uniref:DUF4336 domain-containing protein n=1 Tax=unclassified Leptolyngbya TaxID=2650499 RepID=UPI003D31A7A7